MPGGLGGDKPEMPSLPDGPSVSPASAGGGAGGGSGGGGGGLGGQPMQLTAQEHKILAYLMHHPNRVLSRTEISEHVYARDLDPDSNTLDVLIGRIRRKLGQPQLLVTERGQGFRLNTQCDVLGTAQS